MDLVALGIADQPASFLTREVPLAVLSYAGLEGDRHAGLTLKAGVRQPYVPKGTELRNTRQLSLVSEEELALVAAELGLARLDWRWLGANVLLRGALTLTRLAPGTRLVARSGAVLVVDAENEPCRKAGRAIADAGGLKDWQATPEQLADPEFRMWRWLQNSCCYLLTGMEVSNWIWFSIWLLIGLACYFAYGYRHSKLAPART